MEQIVSNLIATSQQEFRPKKQDTCDIHFVPVRHQTAGTADDVNMRLGCKNMSQVLAESNCSSISWNSMKIPCLSLFILKCFKPNWSDFHLGAATPRQRQQHRWTSKVMYCALKWRSCGCTALAVLCRRGKTPILISIHIVQWIITVIYVRTYMYVR